MAIQNKVYMTAPELAEMLGVSLSKAYRLIRQFNAELEKMGYLTVQGRVSRYYVEKQWYGLTNDKEVS